LGQGEVLGGQILSSPDKVGVNAAKLAREFQPPEAKYDWARGGGVGAKSFEPRQGRGKRSEVNERVPVAESDPRFSQV